MIANETADATKTSTDDRLVVTKAITIDFGAYTYSVPGSLELTDNWCALYIDANTTLKGTTGGIDCLDKTTPDADGGVCGVYALNVREGATLTIEGGHYHGGGTIVQAQLGTVEITGGTFTLTPFSAPYGSDFAFNCKDAAYTAGNAGFSIDGGTFVGFDPQDNKSEGEHTDYTAPGYIAVDDGTGTFTVQEGYVITFEDYDGTVLETLRVLKNGTPVPTVSPTRADDVVEAATSTTTTSYAFDGWTVAAATEDVTYTATYTPTVTVVNYVAQIGATKYETLQDAFNVGGAVTLLKSVALDAMATVAAGKTVTLDLAGFAITPSATWARATSGDALVCVAFGGSLTVTDTSDPSTGTISNAGNSGVYAAVKMTNKGDTNANGTATLVVNAGTLEGYWYAVTGNGQRHGTAITVNGGTLRATANEPDTLAIYHPQTGTLTLNGGVLTGGSGVEMRSGSLVIPAASTVVVTATSAFKAVANGSGSTVEGAAIAISQHTTNLAIDADIQGGTFNATGTDGKAVFVTDTVNADPTGVTATLAGGTFTAPVEIAESAADVGTVIPADSTARFSDADADGVAPGYELVAVEGSDPVVYEVAALAPIQYFNTWQVPNVYYFGDEAEIPEVTTQGTVPKYKRQGASSYVAVTEGDGITVTWTVTVFEATGADGAASDVATVDANGLVTFTAPGKVKVWVTMTEASGAVKSASKTVSYDIAPAYVVSADGQTRTAYGSLYSAFNAAADGETVVLGKDGSGNNLSKVELNAEKSITLDLNGNTFSFSANYRESGGSFITVKKGTLSVVDTGATKGGIVVSGNYARAFNMDCTASESAEDAVLNIGEGVNVSSATDCCVTMFGKCTLNTAGNLTSPNDFAIAGNGSANKNYEGTVINVTGGTITGDEVAIYQPQDGTLNISGGTITAGTAVYVKAGTVSVTGGTLVGTGDAVAFSHNGSGANATGDALVVENCGYPGGTPSVSITGGTFVSENAQSVASYAYGTDSTTSEANEPVADFIPAVVDDGNGGTVPNPARFSDAEADGVPAGYALVEDGEGLYQIVAAVAQIGTKGYETLQDAVDAAADGDTITLLADVNEAVVNANANAFTIDLNGNTWSSTSDVLATTAGTITIDATNGGTMTTEAAQCCAVWAKGGDVVINGGTFLSKDYEEATIYVSHADSVVTINGGTFQNTDERPYRWKASLKALTLNVLNNLEGQHIVINGGTFIGNDPQLGDDTAGGNTAQSDVAFVSDGYVAIEDANNPGTFAVVEGYNVTYKNGDTVLETYRVAKAEPAPETPAYAGETPVKPADELYTYTFAGWDPAVAATVTEDATYTAQFTATPIGDEIIINPTTSTSVVSVPADCTAATLIDKVNRSEGDTLKVYVKSAGYYYTWELSDDGVAGTWEPVTTYVVNGDSQTVVNTPAADTVELKKGEAVWLTRTTDAEIRLMAQYTTGEVQVDVTTGWNLIAPLPKYGQTSVSLNDAVGVPAAAGDEIKIPTAGAPLTCVYNGSEWGRWTYTTNSRGRITGRTWVSGDDIILESGTGFWYVSAGSTSVTLK